jgi:hypothetical protein
MITAHESRPGRSGGNDNLAFGYGIAASSAGSGGDGGASTGSR